MEYQEFTHAAFQEFLRQHKLMGSRCQSCGKLFLPPRGYCPECHQGRMEWFEVSGKGSLAAYTVIYIAPTAMIEAGYGRENPYCSGIINLEDGLSISAQILGEDVSQPENIRIGKPMTVEFIDRDEGGEIRTFLAFRSQN